MRPPIRINQVLDGLSHQQQHINSWSYERNAPHHESTEANLRHPFARPKSGTAIPFPKILYLIITVRELLGIPL